jgi:hypothetical protein
MAASEKTTNAMAMSASSNFPPTSQMPPVGGVAISFAWEVSSETTTSRISGTPQRAWPKSPPSKAQYLTSKSPERLCAPETIINDYEHDLNH